ncbi:hypothetical protein ACFSL4_01175 [Streptomyces caeni]|uniref:Gliding motility protein n=1 Tax=Streptomyces caeni TaxID=2307231 RepID=A0ABW4IHS8_9ACTN
MGVFARLFRRSRTTEEAQSAEAEIPQPAATAATTTAAEATDAATAAAAAAEGTAEEAESGPPPAAAETARPTADGGVAIPGQQSAKDVADSEADERART